MNLRIDHLAEHRELAPGLARWHHAAWSALLPAWTLAEAEAELATHRLRRAIPTTLVAFVDREAVGSVSLLLEDHERITGYSPWLASLYVQPAWRRRGVGAALVERAVAEAAALGVPRLYLYTPDAEAYYRGLGWRECARVELDTGRVSIMSIVPGEAGARVAGRTGSAAA